MTATLAGTGGPLHEAFDAALIDLDGVTYRGPEPIPGAPAALGAARAAGMHIVFVTNNASRTPDAVAAHLTEVGIPADGDEVLTSAQVAAAILSERFVDGDKVLVVGGPGLKTEVAAKGFTLVDSATDGPVAVVQGFSPDTAWRELAEVAYAARAGAYYLVPNRDLTLPNDRGLAPGNGALVRAVVTACEVEPVSAGKPEPEIFRLAAERAGSSAPLVIGDRLDTDIRGANAAGYASLLVLSGVSSAVDAIHASPADRPTFIGESLAALGETHPTPREAESWWHVGEARGRVSGGVLELEGQGIDRVRAACAAAWAACDGGDTVDVESAVRLGIQ